MYSAEDYFWGWVVYISGALCLLYVAWYVMKDVGFPTIRHITLILIAVFLLTPVSAYTDDPRLAPAFFVSMYEGIVNNPESGFERGAAPILALMVFSLFGYLVLRVITWCVRRLKKPPAGNGKGH
jgi:hypothetical protein